MSERVYRKHLQWGLDSEGYAQQMESRARQQEEVTAGIMLDPLADEHLRAMANQMRESTALEARRARMKAEMIRDGLNSRVNEELASMSIDPIQTGFERGRQIRQQNIERAKLAQGVAAPIPTVTLDSPPRPALEDRIETIRMVGTDMPRAEPTA